ncbi:MAG TPA: 2-amino-3,7-dideoxy-D-threo-hept-6-ulosonate synthase [Candidatus Thermoplasmatota archaeon]|nr:2-amino-3,7-dideoxy-D-threo-hept-6-ulosonate synthase [Candidatus Thermoplasmatota archaeon]
MTSLGKQRRLARIVDGTSGRSVMIPMDHGVSVGPAPGIEDPRAAVARVREGGASAVVLQKGLVRAVAGELGRMGLLVHLSASTDLNPDPNDKRLVGTVEECVRLGADGVSVHVNVGAREESRMVEDLGRVATECDRSGMPLLAMMYPRGHEIRDPHELRYVRHVARLGAELGADLVKVPYTGSVETFREVVRGCPVPVLISGGPRVDSDAALLKTVADSVKAGGAGVSIGRNVWQHPKASEMCRAIADIVLRDATAEEAAARLEKS